MKPQEIFLQWHGSSEPSEAPVFEPEVTWSRDRVFEHDVKYIEVSRLDLLHEENCVLKSQVENAAANIEQAQMTARRQWQMAQSGGDKTSTKESNL